MFYYNEKLVEEKSDFGFNEVPNNNPLFIGISKEKETGGLSESFLGGIDELKIYKGSFENKGKKILDLEFNEGEGAKINDEENGLEVEWNLPLAKDFLSKKLEEVKKGEEYKKGEEEEQEKEEEKRKSKRKKKKKMSLKSRQLI